MPTTTWGTCWPRKMISKVHRSSFVWPCKLRPDDANTEANLGSALAEMGHSPKPRSHFEHALQLDPDHALAKENLARARENNEPITERVRDLIDEIKMQRTSSI